jgi:hypothetical protein
MKDGFERRILDRRSILISLIGSAPLAALMAGRTEAAARVSQSAVHYQPTPKDGQQCGQCAQYVTPHACRLVDGDIAPSGWCRLWVKKPS